MRLGLAATMLASMLLPMAAQAEALPGALATARQQLESADYRLIGHLVRVNGNGARTSYAVNISVHWFPGVLRVRLEVASPAEARVHVLLEMRPDGKSTVQVAHPGDKSTSVLQFDKWSDGPVGGEFDYEDFLEAQYFWEEQMALGETKFGARDCDLLVSKPGPSDRTRYAEVKSWLDHASGFPVYVEKTLKGSGGVKELTYFGLRQTRGIWSATQVEAKMSGRAGSTLLIVDRGTPAAHLGPKDFSPAQLTQF
jgi:outer membrane lipoprotein-sorting protein